MFEYREIYQAYKRCIKRKSNTLNAQHFEINLIENLYHLETSLNNQTYKPKKFICFLTSSPKLREVFASDFGDRVVHHIIVPILEQIYEPSFIYDSYSNRKDKGIHQASKRARKFMRGSKYYLQLDIRNFFYTINKDILFLKLKDKIVNNYHKVKGTNITIAELLKVVHTIIWHDITQDVIFKSDRSLIDKLPPHKTLFKIPRNVGLPIGNLTSQFFANVYMNDFDNFVKRKLKVKRYLRYVDDFVLFGDSKSELMLYYQEIERYLNINLKLQLRENIILRANSDGLDFLGYIIRPYYTLTRKRVINNYKYKKAKYLDKYEKQKGKMSLEEIKKFLSLQASFEGRVLQIS